MIRVHVNVADVVCDFDCSIATARFAPEIAETVFFSTKDPARIVLVML